MKSLNFAIALLACSMLVVGQTQKGLKGPRAKNFKPWMKETADVVVLKESSLKNLKGPAFKNHKAWKSDEEQPTQLLATKPRSRVTGPEAKNRKPWEK